MVAFALSHGVALHPRNSTKHSGRDGIKQSGSTLRGGHSKLLVISLIGILHSEAKKTSVFVTHNSLLYQMRNLNFFPN